MPSESGIPDSDGRLSPEGNTGGMAWFTECMQTAARWLRRDFTDDSVTHHDGLDAGAVRILITGLIFWSLVVAGVVWLVRMVLRSVA